MRDMTKNTFLKWLFVAAVITVIFGTIYGVVQQDIRQAANDPQIQLAQDSATALSAGFPPADLLAGAPKTDIRKGLTPFIMVFDSTGTLVASTISRGTDTPPVPPAGVFDYVRAHGEDRVTWQTASGQRFAAVVDDWTISSSTPAQQSSGFVLVARNLREVEKRESQTGTIVFVGWIVSILISVVGFWLYSRKVQTL